MKTTEQEKLHGNVNETIKSKSNSEKLVENHEIEGTPFSAVKLGDQWNLALGRYKINGPFKTKEETIEASKDASWWTVLNVIQAVVDGNKKMDEDARMLETHGKAKAITK